MTALVNTSRAISTRLVTPWKGVWFADVDLDPEDAKAPPAGAVALTIGTAPPMFGTVDPRNSGRFVSSVRLRIVGGAGGWDKDVSPQHLHNDAGVPSSLLYQQTALQVGEKVVDDEPILLGPDYVRSAGPASRVFDDRDWYVDPLGITHVGTRPPSTAPKTLEILGFDPSAQRLDVSCDAIVLPGTTLSDARFEGDLVARDVEQIFDKSGSRASVWCAKGGVSRLSNAFKSMVREFSGRPYVLVYPYRFVLDAPGGRLQLQAIDKAAGLPDVLPITVCPGMAGLSAKLTPSQTVFVLFLEGDPRRPVVVSFDGILPLEATIDATAAVHVGPSAPSVDIAGGTSPLVMGGPYAQLLTALAQLATSLSTAASVGNVATAGGALLTALAALPSPVTVRTRAA